MLWLDETEQKNRNRCLVVSRYKYAQLVSNPLTCTKSRSYFINIKIDVHSRLDASAYVDAVEQR